MQKFYLFLISCAIFLAGCATTSDLARMDARISMLRKENSALEARIDALEKKLSSENEKDFDLRGQFAGLDAEFDRLKSEVRKIKGGYEETEYRLKTDNAAIKTEIETIEDQLKSQKDSLSFHDKRLDRLETYMGLEAIDKFKARVESSLPGKTDINSLSEDELYKVSMQAYARKEMDTALEGFQTFLKKFPGSDKADNARFWIGEIYFSEKWYEKAILEYEDVIKSYPKGNKVPAAYLKQGISFSKLGEKANARLILKTLIKKFPDSKEARIAKRMIADIR